MDWPLADTSSRSSSADQFVAVAQIHRNDAAGTIGVEVGELGLLHQTVAGGEHQIRRVLVTLDLDHLGDPLLRLERQQVGDMLAARRARRLRKVVCLGAVHPALRGEEQDPVVGRADEEVVDDVVLLEPRTLNALTAAFLAAV